MRKLNWILMSALLGSLVLAGCNPPEEKTSEKTDETTMKADEVKKVGDTADPAAKSVLKQEEPKNAGLTKEEIAKRDSAGVQKEAPKTKEELAKESQLKKEAEAAKETTGNENAKPTQAVAKAEPVNRNDVQDRTKPVAPPKPTLPADVNKSAVATSFAGTWKRFIDPKVRAKYAAVEAVQKKRGKKIYPVDNVLTIKGDGTFVWDDNALIVGRKVTGTWSVKAGVATFTIKTIDGKAPAKTEAKTFEAMVSKSGKMLYRNNAERGRYDKV